MLSNSANCAASSNLHPHYPVSVGASRDISVPVEVPVGFPIELPLVPTHSLSSHINLDPDDFEDDNSHSESDQPKRGKGRPKKESHLFKELVSSVEVGCKAYQSSEVIIATFSPFVKEWTNAEFRRVKEEFFKYKTDKNKQMKEEYYHNQELIKQIPQSHENFPYFHQIFNLTPDNTPNFHQLIYEELLKMEQKKASLMKELSMTEAAISVLNFIKRNGEPWKQIIEIVETIIHNEDLKRFSDSKVSMIATAIATFHQN